MSAGEEVIATATIYSNKGGKKAGLGSRMEHNNHPHTVSGQVKGRRSRTGGTAGLCQNFAVFAGVRCRMRYDVEEKYDYERLRSIAVLS
jgi:hypothetical protein